MPSSQFNILLLLVFCTCSCNSDGIFNRSGDISAVRETDRLILEAGKEAGNRPDSALRKLNSVLAMSAELTLPDTTWCNYYISRATALYYGDSLEASIQCFRLALEKANEAKSGCHKARVYMEMSEPLQLLSEQEAATGYLEKAVHIFDSLGMAASSASAKVRLGAAYGMNGQFEAAARAFIEADEVLSNDEERNPGALGALYTNISNNFAAIGSEAESGVYARKALEMSEMAKDTPNIAIALTNLGVYYRYTHPDSALIYYQRAAGLQRTIENRLSTLYNLANIYLDQKNFVRANTLFDSVLVISESIPMPKGVVMALSGKATAASESGDYNKSTAFLKRAQKMADSLGFRDLQLRFAQARYYVDIKNGRNTAALQSLRDWMLLKDSMAVNEKTNAVHTIEKKYQIQRREMEISRLQEARHWQEIKVRDNRIIAILSVLSAVIAALMAYFYASLSRKRKEAYRLLMQQYEETSRRHALEVKQLLVSTTQPDGQEASPARELVRKIHELFQTGRPYLDSQLKVDQLAEKLGVSYRTLNNALKEVEGSTFNRFINRYRVEAVIQMFKQPEFDMIKTQAIAENAGFGSVNSFYEAFQEITGMQPGQFRKMLAEKRDD
jgi:AraC-like DNA-binding protein